MKFASELQGRVSNSPCLCQLRIAYWRSSSASSRQNQHLNRQYQLSNAHRRKGRRKCSCSGSISESFDELDVHDARNRSVNAHGSVEESEMIDATSQQEVVVEAEERAELVAVLVGAALAFGAGIWVTLGQVKAFEYFAGYLLEQSLSVDNLFVFVLVFDYFKTDSHGQEKVLTYGLATAAILRLIMILAGAELIDRFQPVLLGFAVLLLFSAWKLLTRRTDDEEEDLSNNNIVRLCRRFITVTDSYDGDRFFTKRGNERLATPLLLALAVVEISDVVFAVDSIPAVFGITHDPFIIWTSNMMAILSLRALYGFVSRIMKTLLFLDKAVALVLAWIGVKMILDFIGVHVDTRVSLGVVAGLLAGGVGASYLVPFLHKSQTPK